MVVVNQVLVIGIGMHRFHMTAINTIFIEQTFEYWHYRVCGTGCGRNNLTLWGNLVMIDTVDYIGDIIASRCRKQHLGRTRTQVATETRSIFPNTRIINNQRVVNAVFGVINFGGGIRVNHFDGVAVNHQSILIIEDANGTLKCTMHGVTAQQGRTFLEIVLNRSPANHDSAQSQHISPAGFINQNTRYQSADTTKTIEHNILRLR